MVEGRKLREHKRTLLGTATKQRLLRKCKTEKTEHVLYTRSDLLSV
jgi:hypothetical protein